MAAKGSSGSATHQPSFANIPTKARETLEEKLSSEQVIDLEHRYGAHK
jgi:hypothetical protein